MLMQRIATALVLLPIVAWWLFALSLEAYAIGITLVIQLAAWEWTKLMGLKNIIVRLIFVCALLILLLVIYLNNSNLSLWPGAPFPQQLSHWFNARYLPLSLLLIGVLWWLVCLFTLLIGKHDWLSGKSLLWTRVIAGALILVPCWVALISLRANDIIQSPIQGGMLVLYVLLLIWAADTGAYFSGKTFGKHKLAPKVSPKKTWEGVAGGTILSMLIAFMFPTVLKLDFLVEQLGMVKLGIIALVIVIVSIVGDLTESVYKRQQSIKDSGNLLPGHGGVLDRIDSITAALPVFSLLFFWLVR